MVSENYSRVAPLLEEQLSQGGEYTELEYRLVRKDGSTIWIRDNGKLIISDEGIEFIIGICIDVSEKK